MKNPKEISYRRVNGGTSDYLRAGFTAAYKEAFGGHPYYEAYTDDDVIDGVWNPHYSDGIIVLALDGYDVVGFGCAKPVRSSPEEIQEFLRMSHQDELLPIPPDDMWYMSELGVRVSHRGHGIGYALTMQRLIHISELGDTHYVMRTAAEGSNSLHLYRNIGSFELPGRQDISNSDQVMVNKSQSQERVYLYGECLHAIAKIGEIVAK